MSRSADVDSQEEMGTYLALDPAALMPSGRRCLKASGPTTGRRADPMPVRHAPPACKVFFSASIRTYFCHRRVPWHRTRDGARVSERRCANFGALQQRKGRKVRIMTNEQMKLPGPEHPI